MKKITQLNKYLTDKCRVSKQLLLITALCFAFSVNAQLREAYGPNNWGFSGGNPGLFQEFDGRMFFSVGYYSSDRIILKADGTAAGINTVIINSNNSIGNDFPSVSFKEVNSELYFDGYVGTNSNEMRIFKVTSSTAAPTEVFNMTALTGSAGSRFVNPVYLNNKIIFSPLSVTGGVGVEPYIIDITNPANNGVLLDLNNGAASSDPRYFTVFNNEVYFSATDVTNGRELWKTDGTAAGTALLVNLNFGNGSSDPDQYTVLGSKIIFAATNAFTGRELFITDGTNAGTTILKNINPSGGNANPTNLTKIGSEVYFSADNGTDGLELWKTDGTEVGTIMVKNINPSGDSNVQDFIKIGSAIYFTANNGAANGHELWKTDGTELGTVMVKDIKTTGNGNSNPLYLRAYNGKLYFLAQETGTTNNLWVSDGTAVGTQPITTATSAGALTKDLFLFNNELYFNYRESGLVANSLHAYKDPTLSVNDFDLSESQVSLFPNPTNNYFEIESKETLTKVEIYSIQGQIMKNFTTQNQYDISDLSSGVYFVKIKSNNNEIIKRIIKE